MPSRSDLPFGGRCDLKIFKMTAMLAVFLYQNGSNLAILNIHAAPIPSTKFPLHLNYGSRADNNRRLQDGGHGSHHNTIPMEMSKM